LHVYWMVCSHGYKEKRKVVWAIDIESDFSSLLTYTVVVVHANILQMKTDDAKLVLDVVLFFPGGFEDRIGY